MHLEGADNEGENPQRLQRKDRRQTCQQGYSRFILTPPIMPATAL